jgi:AcrR family transcriptional regulator
MILSTPAALVDRETRRTSPRKPSRGRGVLRYRSLLKATDDLLQREDPNEIGLYQIAEKAGVPPASVYHFFPTKEAAYQALAEQYLDALVQMHRQPFEASRIQSWQDVQEFDMRRGADFYNSHPPMLKILYGGYGGVDAKNIDMVVTERMAGTNYDRLNKVFHMPYIVEPHRKFHIKLAILDSIWTISVRSCGAITGEYFEESLHATNAYMRLFLPEALEPREYLVRARQDGATIQLPCAEELEPLAK